MTEDQLRLTISDMLVEMWFAHRKITGWPSKLTKLTRKARNLGIDICTSGEQVGAPQAVIRKSVEPDKWRSATWNWCFEYVIADNVIHFPSAQGTGSPLMTEDQLKLEEDDQ